MTYMLKNVSFHQSQCGCAILLPVMTIKIRVKANSQCNYDDHVIIPQTFS